MKTQLDDSTIASVSRRLEAIGAPADANDALFDIRTRREAVAFDRQIEGLVGAVTIPVGVAGPLRIHGARGTRDYHVPLATTEAALVASYARGAATITGAGGATARVIAHEVTRAPVFTCGTLLDALELVAWLETNTGEMRARAESTTRYGRLVRIDTTIEGNRVYAEFRYTTGEAGGQNMVTIATHAACTYVVGAFPGALVAVALDGNFSSDKKATAQSLLGVRGRRVVAEAIVPGAVVTSRLRSTVDAMIATWQAGAIGGVMAGQIGIQAHYANAIAAVYLACGQDVACTAESAIGITRFERTSGGGLYAAVTLPNVIVGTVGGGTHLPTQRAALALLRLPPEAPSEALAEVVAGICLAGELSLIAAVASNHFAQAHERFARRGEVGR